MPDVRIEDLGRVDNLNDNDYLVVGTEGDTYKTTLETLRKSVSPPVSYKKITQPGLYNASDDGVYGYRTVNVAVNSVEGVKGNGELNYRTGLVNITLEDLGYSVATVAETKAYLKIK